MAWGVPKIGAVAEVASGNLTLAEPAGTAQGDLQIACIAIRSTVGFTNSDWTKIEGQLSGDTDATNGIASGEMWYRVRGAAAGTLQFSRTGGDLGRGCIIAYTGGKQSSAVLGNHSSNTLAVASATATTGTISTVEAAELIVAMSSAGDNLTASAFDAATDPATASGATDTTTAPTAGTWIERSDTGTNTGADGGLAIADAVRSAAGATGTIQTTISAIARHVMIASAFRQIADTAVAAGVGVLLATGFAPTVSATNNVTVTPGVGALTINTIDTTPQAVVGIPISFATSFTGTNGSVPESLTPELGSPLNEIYRTGATVAVQDGYLTATGILDSDYGWDSNGGEYAVSIVVRTRSGVAGTSITEIGVIGAALDQSPNAIVEWTGVGGFTLTYGMWTTPIDTVSLGWGLGETHSLRLQVAGTTAQLLVDGAAINSWTVALAAPWQPYLALYMDNAATQLAAEVSSLTIAPTAAGVVLGETGALTLAGFAPTVTVGANQTVAAGVGVLTLAGFAPTVAVTNNQIVSPSVGVLTLAGFAPTVTASDHQTASPGTGVIAVAGLAPTVQIAVTASPGVGVITIAGLAPTVSATAHVTASPDVGALTLAGFAPTATATDHQTVSPGVGAVTLAGFAPVVETPVTVTPGVGAIVLEGFAPSLGGNVTVNPSVGVIALTGLAPTVLTPRTVTPGVGALTVTGLIPTVTASNHQTASPGTGAVTLTGLTPSVGVSAHVSVTAGIGVLTLAGYAPTVSTAGGATVEPGVGVLTVTGYAPTVDAEGFVIIGPILGALVENPLTVRPVLDGVVASIVRPSLSSEVL